MMQLICKLFGCRINSQSTYLNNIEIKDDSYFANVRSCCPRCGKYFNVGKIKIPKITKENNIFKIT